MYYYCCIYFVSLCRNLVVDSISCIYLLLLLLSNYCCQNVLLSEKLYLCIYVETMKVPSIFLTFYFVYFCISCIFLYWLNYKVNLHSTNFQLQKCHHVQNILNFGGVFTIVKLFNSIVSLKTSNFHILHLFSAPNQNLINQKNPFSLVTHIFHHFGVFLPFWGIFGIETRFCFF